MNSGGGLSYASIALGLLFLNLSASQPVTLAEAVELASGDAYLSRSKALTPPTYDSSLCVTGPSYSNLGLGWIVEREFRSNKPDNDALTSASALQKLDRDQVSDASSRRKCAVVAFLNLLKANLERAIVEQQNSEANELLRAETERERRHVDDGSMLVRARLLQSKARLWTAVLTQADRTSRDQLSFLTGLPVESLTDLDRSLPGELSPAASMQDQPGDLKTLSAFRDVAQLEYASRRAERLRAEVHAVKGSVTLPGLMAAAIEEREALLNLVEIHFSYLEALLVSKEQAGQFPQPTHSAATADVALAPSTNQSNLIRLILTPAVSSAVVGETRKFTLTAVSEKGPLKDVTESASWTVGNTPDAVVSGGGIFTALAPGHYGVNATFQGVTQILKIEVSDDTWNPSDSARGSVRR